MILFRVGATDAEELVKEFTPTFVEEDLVNLPKYEMYLKLMIDGIASDPFSARGLPPLREDEKTGNTEKVIAVSRERYAKNRSIVEEKIMRWHENLLDEGQAKKEQPSQAKVAEGVKKNNSNNLVPRQREEKQTTSPVFSGQAVEPLKPKSDSNKIKAICARCGKETYLSFTPDPKRPVYCRECLETVKKEKTQNADMRKRAKEEELKRLAEQEKKIANNNNVPPTSFSPPLPPLSSSSPADAPAEKSTEMNQ
jgi:CxxC-x17-CxxC domain-containing protein